MTRSIPRSSLSAWKTALLPAMMILIAAKGGHVATSSNILDHLIEQTRATGTLDRGAIGRTVGSPLEPTSETGSFRSFETEMRAGQLTVSVELREPIAGGDAIAGPLLVVRLTGGCPRRQEFESRYGPWTLAGAPRGRSPDEETSWSRKEPWGTLSFGSTVKSPDCVTSLTFQASHRHRAG